MRYVEDVAIGELADVYPNDVRYVTDQWAPQRINAPEAWSKSAVGEGQRELCIIDSGIRWTHEDLNGSRWLGGYDFIDADDFPNDVNNRSHGTAMTGIAAANTHNLVGIAGISRANFYTPKITAENGTYYTHILAAAIDWCAARAEIISMSVGGTTWSQTLADSVTEAYGAGKLLVASAGNGHCSNCVLFPANRSEVIAVVNSNMTNELHTSSSRGPQAKITAPGTSVLSSHRFLDNYCEAGTGTSQAAAVTSGAAALLWNFETSLPNSVVRDILAETATDLGTPSRDATYGFGLLNASAAVDTIYPKALPTCRFLAPSRAPDQAASPSLSGSVTFQAWAKSYASTLSSVTLTIGATTTTLTASVTPNVYEATIDLATYPVGTTSFQLSCAESDGDARGHSREYNIV